MSEYWGYACTDCGAETTAWFNHGEDRLREYYVVRGATKELLASMNWVEISFLGKEYATGIEDFLIEHDGHNVVLRNEYGDSLQILPKPNMERRAT